MTAARACLRCDWQGGWRAPRDQRGVFELRAGPEAEPHLPVYLGRWEGAAFAAYSHVGAAIVLTQAGLVTVIDGVVSDLRPPSGAPAPAGPIVWLR